jgi:hypothetical protein
LFELWFFCFERFFDAVTFLANLVPTAAAPQCVNDWIQALRVPC